MRALPLAATLGVVHAVVDAATVTTVFVQVGLDRLPFEQVSSLILTYTLLAFGLQGPLGVAADARGAHEAMVLSGLGAALAGVLAGPDHAWIAAVAAGVGNALFHVGAGAIVLRGAGGRATGPGVFVAPGTIGLAAGVALGRAACPCTGALAIALVASALALVRALAASPPRSAPRRPPPGRGAALAVCGLLLASTAGRSLISDALAARWRDARSAALLLAAAAFCGKALGGVASDRAGLRRLSVAALALLAACGLAGRDSLALAALGMLLCQMTMGASLAGLSRALPDRPGTAFGLSSAALLTGALPALLHLAPGAVGAATFAPVVWLTAALLFAGLGPVEERRDGGSRR